MWGGREAASWGNGRCVANSGPQRRAGMFPPRSALALRTRSAPSRSGPFHLYFSRVCGTALSLARSTAVVIPSVSS